jgi:cytochrome c-type biogenesis protein CcmE
VEGLGVAVIAIIVACGAFLLLVLILLFVAFRTGRWCFKQPTQLVYIEKEAGRAEQVSCILKLKTKPKTRTLRKCDFSLYLRELGKLSKA